MYLVGGKIRLRNIELSDVEFIKEIENNPENWEFSATYAPYSSYSIEEYIKSEYLGIYENKQQRFVIEYKETKTEIGLIDIFNYDPYNSTAELGLFIKEEYRGQKLGKESVIVLLDYAFNHICIQSIIVAVATDNIKTINLFKDLQFETIGTLKAWKKWKKTRKDVTILQRNNGI